MSLGEHFHLLKSRFQNTYFGILPLKLGGGPGVHFRIRVIVHDNDDYDPIPTPQQPQEEFHSLLYYVFSTPAYKHCNDPGFSLSTGLPYACSLPETAQ